MKKIIVFTGLCLYLPFVSALEYGSGLYRPGWWFGMSNDSFGFGIPSEADDLHTVGLQGGFKTENFAATILYEIYTNRGTSATDHTRTDRTRLLLGWQETIYLGMLELYWQLSATLGFDGNTGGYWVQHLFHITFLNYRQIPRVQDYDTLQFFFGLQPYMEIAFSRGGWRSGIELDALFTNPWLITIDPALFYMYRGGDSLLRFSAAWLFTPEAGSYRTYNLARAQAAGLWLNGYLATGPLFYHFSYNPLQQYTDGRIGYQWSLRTPSDAPHPWDMMEAGIELLNLGPGVVYEDNTFFELFFDSGLPGGYVFIQAKNGGQYVDKGYTYNGKNFVFGAGYEQHLPSIFEDPGFLDPFIGMNLFIEHLREHTFTAYRSTTLAEMGVLGSTLHAGMGFWLPRWPGHPDKVGLRLAAFMTLPHLTFGSGVDSPGLALPQQLRWGLRLGIVAKP